MNTIKETDVCIIGAGPAGATAALQLHQYNIPCIVVDKAVFPRDKVCGDGLSGKVLTILNSIDPAIGERLVGLQDKEESWGVTFVASNRASLDIAYKPVNDGAAGFVCKRMVFDNFLVDEMKRCGTIELIEGTAIDTYTLQQDGYLLSDASGSLRIKAKLIIVANGAHSSFTKDVAGIQMEPKHYCAGLRAYYKNVEGLHPKGHLELHFLKSLLPGYFWIFPLPNGEANVGVGILSEVVRKRKLNLRKMLQDTLENDPMLKERFKDAVLIDKIDGYGLPLGSKKRKLSGERYMLIGDAGHLIDPFTGEGIGNALYSGRYAAQQAKLAIAANNFSAEQLKAYDETIYYKLGPELKLSARLQKLVHRPWLFNYLMKLGMGNKQLRELMSCMFYELDLRKKLTKPSFYVKLLFNRA
ncbi:NAD(P)/FAD-dependent oxidoreductase [Chitinophaga niabensis]|uniref:Geranylgeranyl reductase family n=1 Tax=Chitinophaga niabensis TaxID=536979 RepID=A0A1N6J5V3_9BACT|nr:NAD(P)/FAD-dependent oxidoreductase [Chitinophaga niabensis]SIO39549.1 geranylgeranyl reductase family [Chitinophaga niabensis]